jgi:hypothetical protein
MEWSYAITTVPERYDRLLPQTVAELSKGGFDNPIIVLDGERPDYPSVLNTYRFVVHPQLGHIGNWMLALHYAYLSNPRADFFAVFEDDLLCVRNLRTYLESCPYPEKGYWNLLTHNQNLAKAGPVPGWYLSNQKGWGAVGLVFDQVAVRKMVQSPDFITRGLHVRKVGADGLVVQVLRKLGYQEYIHSPSLLQHVGMDSTLGHHYGQIIGYRPDYDPMKGIENGK